jgi:hypothetical protein
VSIAGNLRTMSLSDLLQWLSESGKTGVLVIDGTAYTKKVFFNHGHVVAVSSDNPREMLGYYLVGWGYCSDEQLQHMIEMQDHFRVVLGELAVKLGHLRREELDHILLVKTEESIYDLIEWDEGEFRFREGVLPERDYLEVDLPVSSFLFEGYRQRDERRRIREAIPSGRHVPVLLAAPQELSDDDAAILAVVNGNLSVEEVALYCRTPEFEVLSLIYRYLRMGLVQILPPVDDEPRVPGAAEAPWLEAAAEVEDRLARGRLLDALRVVSDLEQRYGDEPQALKTLAALKQRFADTLADDRMSLDAILESNVNVAELMRLDCDPAEGFVLSRINGVYSVREVLSQLPGSALHNRVVLHNLIRRGLVKTRDTTGVQRYRANRGPADYLQVSDESDDPFRD